MGNVKSVIEPYHVYKGTHPFFSGSIDEFNLITYSYELKCNVLYIIVDHLGQSNDYECKETIAVKFYTCELQCCNNIGSKTIDESISLIRKYNEMIYSSLKEEEKEEYKRINDIINDDEIESYKRMSDNVISGNKLITALEDQIIMIVKRMREDKYNLIKLRNDDIGVTKESSGMDMIHIKFHPEIVTEMMLFVSLLLYCYLDINRTKLKFSFKRSPFK